MPYSPDILIEYLRFLDRHAAPFAFVWRPGNLSLSVAGFRPFVVPCSRQSTRQEGATQLIVDKLKSTGMLRLTCVLLVCL